MKKLLNSITYIYLYFATLIKTKLPLKRLPAPKNIGKYTLLADLERRDNNFSLAIGIYKYKNKKYFIKHWKSKYKDLNYFYLKKEVDTTILISKYLQNGDILVPKIIEVVENQNSLSAVFEYLEGKSLDTLAVSKQIEVLKNTITSFQKIGKKFLEYEKATIPVKDAFLCMVELPFLVLLALFASPKNFARIFNLTINCVSLNRQMTFQRLVFTHRDLTPDNIIVKNQKIYVLDLENVCFTFPDYDAHFIAMCVRPILSKKLVAIKSARSTFLRNFIELQLLAFNLTIKN